MTLLWRFEAQLVKLSNEFECDTMVNWMLLWWQCVAMPNGVLEPWLLCHLYGSSLSGSPFALNLNTHLPETGKVIFIFTKMCYNTCPNIHKAYYIKHELVNIYENIFISCVVVLFYRYLLSVYDKQSVKWPWWQWQEPRVAHNLSMPTISRRARINKEMRQAGLFRDWTFPDIIRFIVKQLEMAINCYFLAAGRSLWRWIGGDQI